jgi:hypothetical protein
VEESKYVPDNIFYHEGQSDPEDFYFGDKKVYRF